MGGDVREQMVFDLEGQVATEDVKELAAGQVCRSEDLPEVPLAAGLGLGLLDGELLVPSGKCPQKMIMYDQTLRIRLAVRFPVNTQGANGPANSGNAT